MIASRVIAALARASLSRSADGSMVPRVLDALESPEAKVEVGGAGEDDALG
jgi:hypothetical protein